MPYRRSRRYPVHLQRQYLHYRNTALPKDSLCKKVRMCVKVAATMADTHHTPSPSTSKKILGKRKVGGSEEEVGNAVGPWVDDRGSVRTETVLL